MQSEGLPKLQEGMEGCKSRKVSLLQATQQMGQG